MNREGPAVGKREGEDAKIAKTSPSISSINPIDR
jgi:hypothetical protein